MKEMRRSSVQINIRIDNKKNRNKSLNVMKQLRINYNKCTSRVEKCGPPRQERETALPFLMMTYFIQNDPEKIVWAQNRKRKSQEQIQLDHNLRLSDLHEN
jgi:hypothetical protein